MKKIYSLIVVAGLTLTMFGGSVSAKEVSKKDHKFNWDEAWENVEINPEYYPSDISFVGGTGDTSQVQTMSFSEYATGSTALRFYNYYVYSKGVTKGESLWTTTSAYTGLRNVTQSGITVYGERDTAIAYGDAISEAKRKYIPLDGNFFTGVTVHTATMSGVIYEKATSDSEMY